MKPGEFAEICKLAELRTKKKKKKKPAVPFIGGGSAMGPRDTRGLGPRDARGGRCPPPGRGR